MKTIKFANKKSFIAILVMMLVVGIYHFVGYQSDAAEGLYLTCDGFEMSAQTAYQMKSREITLVLGDERNPIYADTSLYQIKWSIETGNDIAEIQQSPTSPIYGIVKAKSPGEVTVLATVINKAGGVDGAVIGSVSCKIQVVFAVDTSKNDNVFKKPYRDSEDKAIFLRTTDQPIPLTLNYGEAKSNNVQWISANEEVAKVANSGSDKGTVTPVGAGRTKITATYTPTDSPNVTYSTTIDVYVYPGINDRDSDFEKIKEIQMNSGGVIYTDAVFTSNIEAIQQKMDWVIKKDDGNGGEITLANSLGMTSDLIRVSAISSRSNQLKAEGKAGKYYVYFYPKGAYESETRYVDKDVYAPTVLTLSLFASPNDYEDTIPIDGTFDIADAFNFSIDEFVNYFDVTPLDFDPYATYDRTTGLITAVEKRENSTTTVTAEVRVKQAYENYVRSLLPGGSTVLDQGKFTIKITIADVFRLSQNFITMYQGSELNVGAYFNDKKVMDVEWSSSDDSYVGVDANGNISAKRLTQGDVLITAKYMSGSSSYSATCRVNVVETPGNFDIDPAEAKLNIGETIVVKVKGNPEVSEVPASWWDWDKRYLDVDVASDGQTATVTAVKVPGDGSTTELLFKNPNISDPGVRCKVTVISPYESIKLEKDTLELKKDSTYQLQYTFTPKSVTEKTLEWTSLDTSIVTVDEYGYVTAINPGTTMVMVSPKYNPNKIYAQCMVTVLAKCEMIDVSPQDIILNVGETKYANLALHPMGCDPTVSFEVGNDEIIDYNYREDNRIIDITGKKAGKTTINVRADDATRREIRITVLQPCTELAFSPATYDMMAGETYMPTLKKTPEDTTDTITWNSYNAEIADVDKKGLITAKKTGVTFIQATSTSGRVAVIQISVKEGLTSVTLNPDNATIQVGESITLSPDFVPAVAFDKSMKWSVADSSVAKMEPVGESGVKITGLKGGMTLVKGVANDGGHVVSCLVTVTEKTTSVKVSPKTKYLQKGKTFTIKATVDSPTATNKSVKWTSSKKSVATVNTKGQVKGKKIGTAYITATAKDGSGASATCKVMVIRKVTKLTLNKYTAKLLVGNTMKLKAKITPKNASVKGIAWSSSDNTIATVDATGRVQGIAAGLVKIRAKAKDGSGKSAVCLISVSDPVPATGVDVQNSEIIVAKGRQIQSGIQKAPLNSTDKIRYYSDNKKVARINQRGKIFADRVGQATVYGETSNGLLGCADVLVVCMNRTKLAFRQYDTETLRVDEINNGVTWYSANPMIASVDQSGKVIGRKRGVTRIYAKVRGLRLSCKVTVIGID